MKLNLPELYDFQKDAVEHGLTHNPDMIVVPTGEGKTIVALKIIEYLNTPTIIVVPTIELVKQWERVIREYGGECTTYSSGSSKEFSDLTVITYVSMLRNVERVNNYGLIVFDEVHHLFADEFVKIGKEAIIQNKKVIGLTASPRNLGPEEIIQNKMFPDRYVRTILQRQNSNRAVDLKFHTIPVEFSEEDMRRYNTLWSAYVSEIRKHGGFREMATYGSGQYNNSGMVYYQQIKKLLTENPVKIRKTLEIIRSNPEGRFIVFVDTIKMVGFLSKYLMKNGITSVKIHASKKGMESQTRKEREKIINDLKEGKARVLLGCNAIEEGLDLPDMDNAIFLSNFSSSSRKVIQRAGRAMRSLPGKEVGIHVICVKGTKEEDNLDGIKKILGVK